MKFDKWFQIWVRLSLYWLFFSIVGGGTVWKFPMGIEAAWKNQKSLIKQSWQSTDE